MEILIDPKFWSGLTQVIFINLVLSADNAVVIALAARTLPPRARWQALVLGATLVVVARLALTLVAAQLLQWPLLKIIGAVLLFWIAIRLLAAHDGDDETPVAQAAGRVQAVQRIIVADLVMSLDNVLSVAAAAQGHGAALIAGLAVSIPMVIFSAAMLSTLMQRWPVIIIVGAGLLGWVAGGLLVGDPLWSEWIDVHARWLHVQAGEWTFAWTQILGVALVLGAGGYYSGKSVSR